MKTTPVVEPQVNDERLTIDPKRDLQTLFFSRPHPDTMETLPFVENTLGTFKSIIRTFLRERKNLNSWMSI